MIALFISLMMLAAVITVFVNTQKSFHYQQGINELNDNIRYAISTMTYDLRMAGHWGGASRAPRADDLATGGGIFKTNYLDACTGFSSHLHELSINTDRGLYPVSVISAAEELTPTKPVSSNTSNCISNDSVAESDILTTIYAVPEVVADADLVEDGIYQRSRVGFAPALVAGQADATTNASHITSRFPAGSDLQDAFNLPLRITHYTVSHCPQLAFGSCTSGDGPRRLMRSLVIPESIGVGWSSVISPGVEAMSFLMMVDTTGNGDDIRFLNATDLRNSAAFGTNPFDVVKAISINMVVRSEAADIGITSTSPYTLPGPDYTPDSTVQKFPRRQVTTTVQLRNNQRN